VSASITLTVGAQSLSRSSTISNSDALDLLRDAASHLVGADEDIDLQDPVTVAQFHLGRWARDLRSAAHAHRRSLARDDAEAGVPDPLGQRLGGVGAGRCRPSQKRTATADRMHIVRLTEGECHFLGAILHSDMLSVRGSAVRHLVSLQDKIPAPPAPKRS
jgi:hypothetical protein